MRGRDAKTYYDLMTNWAAPSLTELAKVIDETVTPTAEVVAGGSRESEHEDNEVTMHKFGFNLTYRYKKTSVGADAVYTALLGYFEAGTTFAMYFLDGAKQTGAKGWRSPVKLTEMPLKRDLGGMSEVTIQGVGCLYDNSGTILHRESYASAATTTTAAPTTTTTAP